MSPPLDDLHDRPPGAVKQVIVIRRDLKMRRGKEVAQGAHASMAWLAARFRRALDGDPAALALPPAAEAWLRGPFAKICVRVNSEAELRAIHRRATDAGLISELIIDAGRTEFGGVPTPTACAVGPDLAGAVDAITGALELY